MSELKNASLASDMSQPENTKMFVGGLSWETTLDTFTQYFENYGEITDSVIMKDGSGKPRGFGFVTFKKPCSVGSVLGKKEHKIDGKHVDPKLAEKRGTSSNHIQAPLTPFPQPTAQTRKIFVGGIPPGTTEDELKKHFVSYGNVVKVEIKLDKESNRPRGFGFLTLDDDKSVEKICKDHFFQINGKQVECKLAQDPPSGQDMPSSHNLMNSYPPGYSYDPSIYYAYAYCYGSQGYPYGQYYPYSNYGYNYSTGDCYGLNQDGNQRNFNAYFAQSAYPSTGSQQHSGYQGYYPIQGGDAGQTTTNGGGTFSRAKNGSNNNIQSRGSNSSGGYY